jgi:hypothetical protein
MVCFVWTLSCMFMRQSALRAMALVAEMDSTGSLGHGKPGVVLIGVIVCVLSACDDRPCCVIGLYTFERDE